ncbi:hypothetical protein TURU_067367 [Turdus rufiventris]|nr:hypothetical protein TURU_067367 [Turdus rufiventris]
MPVPDQDAQSLERDCRAGGEHLKGSTKEFQPLQSVRQLRAPSQMPLWNYASHGNKQESETCTPLQGHDLVGIMETGWDGSYDWSTEIKGHRFFRRHRQADKEGMPPSAVTQLKSMVLPLGMDEDPTESLWDRTKGREWTEDITVRVYYRPPKQEDQMEEVIYRQIKAA